MNCVIRSVLILMMCMTSLQSWAVKSDNLPENELVENTEQLLRLAKSDLEKMANKFTIEQKLVLRRIAFNKKADLQIRWRALVLATRLLGGEMRTDIHTASKSSDWFMRSAAMMAASEISTEEAALLARRMIKDKALVVRSAAVDILGSTGEDSDRELLWHIIKDPINLRKGQSLWIRSQALQLLAKSPQKKEISQYVELLRESDLELQAIAIHALEKTSDFQFGSTQDSIEEHRRRWLNWWETSGKVKTL